MQKEIKIKVREVFRFVKIISFIEAAKDVPEKDTGSQQVENLKRAPYLLHDGDVIGYRLEGENVEKKDDFQTKEDEEVHKTNF